MVFLLFFAFFLLQNLNVYQNAEIKESLQTRISLIGYFCRMQPNKFCFLILLVFLTLLSDKLSAQTGQIDTIIVNLTSDTNPKTPATTKEPTPVLNLGALRTKAREDSIRIAQIALEKEATEKEQIAAIKEKRKEEKALKEKAQKELAEKKKIKKAEKKNIAEAKKAEEKLAKKEAVAKKEAAEKIAQAKAQKEKLAKQKAEKEAKAIAKKKAADKAKVQKKYNAAATEKATELAKAQEIASQQKQAELAKEKAKQAKAARLKLEKASQQEAETQKSNTLTEIAEQKKEQTTISTTTKKVADQPDLPKPPKGVVQKDNPYGTVRLAYDDNAASFLLSIPTETKMHYHATHSEHVMLIEGDGMLLMGYKTIKLKKNELIFITKGTPHKIINNGKSKLKILSIQSPFYDGTDIIILE